MENLRLQENLAQRQRAETLRSNAAKKQDETNKSMIKKIKYATHPAKGESRCGSGELVSWDCWPLHCRRS